MESEEDSIGTETESLDMETVPCELERINSSEKINDNYLDGLFSNKVLLKRKFTCCRRALLVDVAEGKLEYAEIQERSRDLEDLLNNLSPLMGQIIVELSRIGERKRKFNLIDEMNEIEDQFSAVADKCAEYNRKEEKHGPITRARAKEQDFKETKENEKFQSTQTYEQRSSKSKQSGSSTWGTVGQPPAMESEDSTYSTSISFSQPTSDHLGGHVTGVQPFFTQLGLAGPWQQLKKVSLAVFSGDKRQYANWRASFSACVDASPLPSEYKLLQLREYLSGDALASIDCQGYGASAYDAAKARLDRKYGGNRRKVALQLEALESIQRVCFGKYRDFERFAEVLDIAVVNLRDSDQSNELGTGTFYTRLLKKLDEQSIAQYQRWLHEHGKDPSVIVLLEWVTMESEFLTVAAETTDGLSKKTAHKSVSSGKSEKRSYHLSSQDKQEAHKCSFCNGSHRIWKCPEFASLDVNQRWLKAKELRLCYRCLGSGHLGSACRRFRKCGRNDCQDTHHYLLHGRVVVGRQSLPEDRTEVKDRLKVASSSEAKDSGSGSTTEGEQVSLFSNDSDEDSVSMVTKATSECRVALRTVPVILKSGDRSVKVDALLDDGSNTSYVNSSVASELGLQGKLQKTKVSVLNDRVESFVTMPVTFEVHSIDGSYQREVTALTTDRVPGSLKAVDWVAESRKWPHLANVPFPERRKRTQVDLLIGADYSDFHYSLEDVKGKPGEPIARQTPLGWTCIGVKSGNDDKSQAFVAMSFHTTEHPNDSLGSIVQRFWEVEECSSSAPSMLATNEALAQKKVDQTLALLDGRYQVGIPWNKSQLSNNFEMAKSRLRNTKKKLCKDATVAKAYCDTILQYVSKGYVRKLSKNDNQTSWLLPHFPVVRLSRTTTKVRIVFDAAAMYQGFCLNDAIEPGPKLQLDLFDVLLRFRRFRIAVACDISEMYLQILVQPADRTYLRFLWSEDDVSEPDIYEFNRLVFGLNVSPFAAQFVVRQHAQSLESKCSLGTAAVLNATYMDDTLESVSNLKEAHTLYEQLNEI